jgi:hypothetical protein
MKDWEIIADNLSKAGWSWGCVSAIDSRGRTIWIVDAHRDDGQRFVAYADEILTAFLELERAVCIQLLVNNTNHNRSAGGKRFVVRADEKLTAFVELERVITSARQLVSVGSAPTSQIERHPEPRNSASCLPRKASITTFIEYAGSVGRVQRQHDLWIGVIRLLANSRHDVGDGLFNVLLPACATTRV